MFIHPTFDRNSFSWEVESILLQSTQVKSFGFCCELKISEGIEIKENRLLRLAKCSSKSITNNAFLFLVLQRKLSSKKNPSEIKCLYFPEYKHSSLNPALCNCWFLSPPLSFPCDISNIFFNKLRYIHTIWPKVEP